jgi:ABC-type glutathione transport system ATPase component
LSARAAAPVLLQVDNLSPLVKTPATRFAPGRVVAPSGPGASFVQAAGERLAIVGPAEALSPLARAIALIDKPGGGRVRLAGDDLTRAWGGKLRTLRRTMQYVSSEARRALPPFADVGDILAEPLQVHKLGRPADRPAQVAAAAAAWQVNGWLLKTRVSGLSNAMCQRVALARACLLSPRLLVCDRLTERLEYAAAAPLLALLKDYCDQSGTACLLITSDPALAAGFATRTLRLEAGELKSE